MPYCSRRGGKPPIRRILLCKQNPFAPVACLATTLIAIAMIVSVYAAPGPAFATPNNPIVVSMGDSYSAGEGVPDYYGDDDPDKARNEDFVSHRSENSWPGQLQVHSSEGKIILKDKRAKKAESGDWFGNWCFVAASGATINDLYEAQSIRDVYDWELGQEIDEELDPQMDVLSDNNLGGRVDYITITIGGNDVRFAPIVKTAAMSNILNFGKLNDEIDESWKSFNGSGDDDTGSIKFRLEQAYKDLQQKGGGSTEVIVAGYPQLFDPLLAGMHVDAATSAGTALAAGSPPPLRLGPVMFDCYEAFVLNSAVSTFNARIKDIIDGLNSGDQGKFHFVSVEEHFKNHGAYSLDPYISSVTILREPQDINPLGFVSARSMHPNAKGIEAYRAAVQKKIDELEKKNLADVANTAADALSNAATNAAEEVAGNAAPAESAPSRFIETPYYTIALPEEWEGEFESSIDMEEHWNPGSAGSGDMGLGYHVRITRANGETFGVGCFTNNWGVQGDVTTQNLGEPSDLPGWNVFVYAPRNYAPAIQDASVYAQYVTVNRADDKPEISTDSNAAAAEPNQPQLNAEFSNRMYLLDIPDELNSGITFETDDSPAMRASINGIALFTVVTSSDPTLAARTDLDPYEAKKRKVLLGTATPGFYSENVGVYFYYIAPSGLGNAHWNNSNANELAVERLLGMSAEELAACIKLADMTAGEIANTPPEEVVYKWKDSTFDVIADG